MTTEQRLSYHNNLVKVLDLGVTTKIINGKEYVLELTKHQIHGLRVEIDRVAVSLNHAYWLRGKGLIKKPKRLRVDD